MADAKISALPASTTPLAGTEVLPIVQGGQTRQVSIANVTAGRAVNALSVTSTNDGTFNGVRVGRGAGNNSSSVAVGTSALGSNTTDQNTAVGYIAAYQSTAAGITAFGANVLQNNTTGGINSVFGGAAAGSYNAAMAANITGGQNAVFGSGALSTSTAGGSNAAFGIRALSLATGDGNTAIGWWAGNTATTGSNNGFFGYNAQPSSVTVSNEYTYGNSAVTKHRFVGGDLVIGTAGKGLDFGSSVLWRTGAGTPEGVVTAAVGSLYTRTDGGLLSTLYVKESGAGNTGWVAK
jgi:hypothetical protein